MPIDFDKIYDVVIIGGGPIGMGLAIELGQRGKSVAVVEKHTSLHNVPKGQNLTQRTVEHFHFWGCRDELHAARSVPKDYAIGGMTSYASLLSGYHYDWMQRGLVRPYYFADNERLPQYKTEQVLRDRVAQIDSVDIEYGWAGAAVSQDYNKATVTVRNRAGDARTLTGRYLVGADGSNSAIRQAARITQTKSDHDKLMVLLVFKSTELHEHLKRYPDKQFYCVLNPELAGYWMFFGRVDLGTTWFFHAPVPLGTTKDNFDFKAYLHQAVGADFEIEFDHIGFWELRFALADSYRAGRVFVAGDSAHSHPPYGGYGINTGFEDARNLGWKLAARLDGWGSEALLDSYHEERQRVFASTADDFIERFIVEDRDFLNTYSPDKDLAEFKQVWNTRNQGSVEVMAFAPNYDGSSIVFGRAGAKPGANASHEFKARAGHHLAPAVLSDGSNVFDHLGDGFTLLALGAVGDAADETLADFKRSAAELQIPLTIVADPESPANSVYAANLVLVRPDQFVAWTGDGLSGQAVEILKHIVAAP